MNFPKLLFTKMVFSNIVIAKILLTKMKTLNSRKGKTLSMLSLDLLSEIFGVVNLEPFLIWAV